MLNPSGRSAGRGPHVLALILAGGPGTRLKGLTEHRAKPAVPFGAHYRVIDFTLSNCVNSGLRQIALLTQYKAQSLIRHVQTAWSFAPRELGEFIEVWPAQQRRGERWYAGTGDAIHQNLDLIESLAPDLVLVLAGDHVYSMDYRPMLRAHIVKGADITVGAVEVPLQEARGFGVLATERDGRVHSFVEKPERPPPMPGRTDVTLASMGIYVFTREALIERLERDAADPVSGHDFGYDVLPRAVAAGRVFAYPFYAPDGVAAGYWRDIGTVDAYWRAHMELLADGPAGLDLFDPAWPIRTGFAGCRPARTAANARVGAAMLGAGARIDGDVFESVVSADCIVGAHSRISESVLLPGARVGEGCVLERVVIDSRCVVPDGTVIDDGRLPALDELDCVRSPGGIALVTPGRSRSGALASRKVA